MATSHSSSLALAALCVLACVPLSTAFCPSLAAPSLASRSAVSGFAVPNLRLRSPHATRHLAVLSMVASDWYKMEKKADVNGGAKYEFNVNVDGQMSKDSYGMIESSRMLYAAG